MVEEVAPYYNVATTGIGKNIPQLTSDTAAKLLATAKLDAKAHCKSEYFAIDNWEVTSSTFGEYNNVLVTYSCNMVCLSKPKGKVK